MLPCPQCPSYSLSEEALEGNLVSKRQNVTWVIASFFLRTIFKRFFRETLKIIIHPPSVGDVGSTPGPAIGRL